MLRESERKIRVGTRVRLKVYPDALTDLTGEPVIDPAVLLESVWPVTSVCAGVIGISFHGAGFVNRTGRIILGYSGRPDDFVAVGYEAFGLCKHCQPILSILMLQPNQAIIDFSESGWPGDGRSMNLELVPSGQLQKVLNPSAPVVFHSEQDVKVGSWNGLICQACGDSIGWPFQKKTHQAERGGQ